MICKFILTICCFSCLLFTTCDEDIKDSNEQEIYAIYISEEKYSYDLDINIDDLSLITDPFLTSYDITSYYWNIHKITYSDSTYSRLIDWGDLLHHIFVVTVGNDRIYWGLFMDSLDSGTCQNPVIMLGQRCPDLNTTPPFIIINRAYPEYFGDPNDPDSRNDPRIYNALSDLGLLIE